MSLPTLKISTSDETRYDFDVSINGLEDSAPEVRFIVEGGDFDASVACVKSSSGWSVCIPALPLTEAHGFRVEVVVDGYHFVPVTGDVQLISTPKVGLKETFTAVETVRPSVSASFTGVETVMVETKAEKKRLIEHADLGSRDRRELSQRMIATATILTKSSKLLEDMVDKEHISTQTVANIFEVVQKSLASVEVKIYL